MRVLEKRVLVVAIVGAAWLGPRVAEAAVSDCMNRLGDCEVSNDGQDSFSCDCSDGSGGFGGGGNDWAGLSQAELDAVCLDVLQDTCGVNPVQGVPCESMAGSCVVDNEPDFVSCECTDGSGGAGGGGNDWDGLTDDELYDVCLMQLDEMCGVAPPPDWDCENDFGGCDIQLDPDPQYVCGCTQGGGGGGPGDPGWSELSPDELDQVCQEQLQDVCGGPEPTTGVGTDTGSTDTDGTEGGTSATTDATETGGVTDATATATATAGEETTGNPTGDEATASATADGGATMTASASASAGESSDGGEAGGANDGDSSGCNCDVQGGNRSGMLGLAALAWLGARRRRRR